MLAARRVPADRFSDGVPGAGREPNVVLLHHIVQKNILLITGSASEAGHGFRAGAGIGFRIPLTGSHQIRADASYSLWYTSYSILSFLIAVPVFFLRAPSATRETWRERELKTENKLPAYTTREREQTVSSESTNRERKQSWCMSCAHPATTGKVK